jgi:hypothetical protein
VFANLFNFYQYKRITLFLNNSHKITVQNFGFFFIKFLILYCLCFSANASSSPKKTPKEKSFKEKSKIKNLSSKRKNNKLDYSDEIDDDKIDFFDYEALYKNTNSSKIITENPPQSNNSEEFLSDFGIIKNTLEEKKTIKKYEEEDDEIFLNKEIFDEKNKIKLRKSLKKEPPQTPEKFKISNRIVNDLNLSNNFGNPQNKFFNTSGVVRYFSSIQINRDIEFYGLFRLATVDNRQDVLRRERDPRGGGSRTFENLGITLSELSFKYTKKNSSIIAGKFTANFGSAWRWNRGIVIHSLASNYALTDKLGFAMITKYGDIKKTGLYNFSLSLFTNDRKNFDNSLFHRRDSDSKSDAIAGDTRKLNSYSFTTDVNFVFSDREKLNYHIGFSKLAINKRQALNLDLQNIKKQQGIVFGMNYEFPINKDFTGETLIESAKIKNINGVLNTLNSYLTTNFILKYDNKYSLLIGNSINKNRNNLLNHSRSNISEINIGYDFSKNKYFDKLTTQIGYHQNIEKGDLLNRKNKAIAFLIRYSKNF